jgi:hypothetical protein
MEFYTKFRELYNISKANEKSIEIKDEEWKDFNKKLSSYTLENLEDIYKFILHFIYLLAFIVYSDRYEFFFIYKNIINLYYYYYYYYYYIFDLLLLYK